MSYTITVAVPENILGLANTLAVAVSPGVSDAALDVVMSIGSVRYRVASGVIDELELQSILGIVSNPAIATPELLAGVFLHIVENTSSAVLYNLPVISTPSGSPLDIIIQWGLVPVNDVMA